MTTMAEIRIVLVDDSELMRGALRALVETQAGMRVVGEAGDGEEAVKVALQHAPDVVLLDVAMPGLSGTEAARRLEQAVPAAKILAFSGYDDEARVREMLAAGADGFIRKSAAPDEIVRAIRQVAAGARYLDAALPARVADAGDPDQAASEAALTGQEVKVLALFAQGYPMAQIASMLSLDRAEVERHKAAGMRELHVTTRAQLARVAAARGWI